MKKTIYIEGMMCEHCVKKVEEKLKEFYQTPEVSLSEKKAVLKDSTATDEEIIKAIESLNFEVIKIENE